MVSAIFTSVVFPAPLGPSNPKIVPGSTTKLTSFSACTVPLALHQRRNVFDKEIASKANDMASDYSVEKRRDFSLKPLGPFGFVTAHVSSSSSSSSGEGGIKLLRLPQTIMAAVIKSAFNHAQG